MGTVSFKAGFNAVSLRASLTSPAWLQACALALFLPGCSENVTTTESAPDETPATYVGSAECQECHASIYADWQTTWHSFSVRSAVDAEASAYPQSPTAVWQDVSYVFGGRQRIAYLDAHGDLAQPSFDVRRQLWDEQFPDGNIRSCAPCHFTGPLLTDPAPPDPRHPVPQESPGWAELTIGCEACHGPGSRHTDTFAKQDITVDTSSTACGACHTAMGRVLPTPDTHATHDLVQVWHRDPHTRGLSQHTMSAHCATCHDPGNGTHGPFDDSARLVFKEDKSDISCTSCHDPHRSTNPDYRRNRAPADPPLMSLLQRHSGRDGDFTSSDYTTVSDTETQCRSCHSGADRVDLNHGDATCVDCHNAFYRTRTRDSLVLHDANQRELSCRACHQNADHLITLIFQDPDFLEPRLIHNLAALPPAVVERHGFGIAAAADTTADDVQLSSAQRRLVIPELAAPATAVELPDFLMRQLEEVIDGIAQSDPARANAALAALCHLHTNDALLTLGVLPHSSPAELAQLKETVTQLMAADIPSAADERFCLQALSSTIAGQTGETLRAVTDIPADTRGDFVDALGALAYLERNDARSAVQLLQPKLEADKPLTLLRTVAALAQARRNRPDDAHDHLEQMLSVDPSNAVTWFVAGKLAADSQDFAEAAESFLRAAQIQPDWIDATLSLGRALIFNQQPNEALAVLEHAARSWPAEFDTRYRLGSLFKLLSDQLRHQVGRASENRPPEGMSAPDWQFVVDTYLSRAGHIADRAYGEYVYALAQKPGDQRTVWQTAEVLRALERHAEAREMFLSLSRRDPNEWLYPYRAAMVEIAENRLTEAIDLLQTAHTRRPDQADVLAALGFALLKSGRPTEAVAQLVKANAFEPFNPAAFNNLGVARARLDDLASAERALQRGLELRTFPLPRTHLLHTNLALVLAKSGRHAEAIAAAKRALYVFPGFKPAKELLAGLEAGDLISLDYQLNDQLELFGELSTVSPLDLTL